MGKKCLGWCTKVVNTTDSHAQNSTRISQARTQGADQRRTCKIDDTAWPKNLCVSANITASSDRSLRLFSCRIPIVVSWYLVFQASFWDSPLSKFYSRAYTFISCQHEWPRASAVHWCRFRMPECLLHRNFVCHVLSNTFVLLAFLQASTPDSWSASVAALMYLNIGVHAQIPTPNRHKGAVVILCQEVGLHAHLTSTIICPGLWGLSDYAETHRCRIWFVCMWLLSSW